MQTVMKSLFWGVVGMMLVVVFFSDVMDWAGWVEAAALVMVVVFTLALTDRRPRI